MRRLIDRIAAGVEPATISEHSSAEATADLERRPDDGVMGRRNGAGSRYMTLCDGLQGRHPVKAAAAPLFGQSSADRDRASVFLQRLWRFSLRAARL